MDPILVLVPSPSLGPASWEPTARALESAGRTVRVPSLQNVATSDPPYWPVGVESIVRAAGGDPVVLVPHSNAGLYVPSVVERLGDQVRGAVFVDAALPGVGHYAPPEFYRALADDDGLLPPWTSWWDEADVATLFPDDEVRARVEAEQGRIPLAYYDQVPPAPDGWDSIPCSYLWFGEPYGEGAEQVAAWGWPTRHVRGEHLHMVVDPDAVAAAVLDLTR